jgi:hypothetical protein
MPTFFSESVIAMTMGFTWMIRAYLTIMRGFHIFPSILNSFLTLSKTLCTSAVKFPASTSEHITNGTRKLNKLRQRTRIVRPNRNTKDVLLLHDNARPHVR